MQNQVKVSMRVVNSVKDVEVDENGRKIFIHEDKDGISIEVVGQEPMTYVATSLEELEKAHPAAFHLYMRYAGVDVPQRFTPPWGKGSPNHWPHPAGRFWSPQ